MSIGGLGVQQEATRSASDIGLEEVASAEGDISAKIYESNKINPCHRSVLLPVQNMSQYLTEEEHISAAVSSFWSTDKKDRAIPMDKLFEATFRHGLVPPVVPEFLGITVGGATKASNRSSQHIGEEWMIHEASIERFGRPTITPRPSKPARALTEQSCERSTCICGSTNSTM
jgi:hypothetical protein